MKIKLTVILGVLIVLGLTACGGSSQKEYNISEAGTWADGIYSTTAEGKNGSFDVAVTIEDGYITNINAEDNRETEDIGGAAIEELTEKMTQEQTYDVDAVSGATVTSEALKEAAARCLELAS
ncbi:MAG: FMN-binding protein [Clostridiales bacterium]|nr:FMN-binding protein [Clostridiales bacterium]MCD8215362.1 FMN-binding protein [Clostridiales bacterium]